MKKNFLFVILATMITKIAFSQKSEAIKVPVMDFEQLEPILHISNDSVYFVNFWATWCIPCRNELPVIMEINKKYSGRKFKIILISLDFLNQIDTRLVPFLKQNQITSQVILLNDPNQNKWIDKVDPAWYGELPFTLIYGKGFRQSYSRSFQFQELDSIINKKLSIL